MTHPFHPLYGKTLALVTCHQNWGEQRVYYQDEGGTLCSLPLAWTSLVLVDAFVQISAGQAAFRVADLLEMAGLLHALLKKAADETVSLADEVPHV